MNNIMVISFKVRHLFELPLSLREGFVTFDCGHFVFRKIDIEFLLNAV